MTNKFANAYSIYINFCALSTCGGLGLGALHGIYISIRGYEPHESSFYNSKATSLAVNLVANAGKGGCAGLIAGGIFGLLGPFNIILIPMYLTEKNTGYKGYNRNH